MRQRGPVFLLLFCLSHCLGRFPQELRESDEGVAVVTEGSSGCTNIAVNLTHFILGKIFRAYCAPVLKTQQ